jgi:hypothetical protein
MVDRINHDLQRFRLVGDLVQVDDFDASERLAVVVDERGWPGAGPRGSAFLPKVADRPAVP